MKLLIDENISPATAEFLSSKDYDVKTVRENNIGASDREIVELAEKENRCIVTQDSDFGEIYYFSNEENLKIAVVKPSRQRISTINKLLERQLPKIENEDYGLFIIQEEQIRELK